MGKLIHNGITYANINYEIGPGLYPVQNIDLIPVKPTDNTNIIYSGSYSSGTTGYRAFDGDINTSWASQSSTTAGARYVGYKFSEPVLCNKYTIAYNNSGSWFLQQYPNTYVIQGSNDDGVTWVDLYDDIWVLTSDPSAVVYRTRTFENDTAYKWYRFLINKAGSSGSDYCLITEITLYQAIYGYVTIPTLGNKAT